MPSLVEDSLRLAEPMVAAVENSGTPAGTVQARCSWRVRW